MLTLLSGMAMTIAAADDSTSMLQQQAARSKKLEPKSWVAVLNGTSYWFDPNPKTNFSEANDCLTRTNFHRTKWGLAPMVEEPSCFACVRDASCSNSKHGAHTSSNYGINCPLHAQNEGNGGSTTFQHGGSTCAGSVDSWYNERYSCSTSAGIGTYYKVVIGKEKRKKGDYWVRAVVGKRACMAACTGDPRCKSFDYRMIGEPMHSCRLFETGQTPEPPATCSESAFEVGISYKSGHQLGMQNATSAKDCCNKCSSFSGEQRCKYFTFIGSSNQCWLKYNNDGRRTEQATSKAVSGGPSMLKADPNTWQYCSGGTSGHGGVDGNCQGHCGAVMRGPEHGGGLVMSCAGCDGRWTCNYGLTGKVCDTSCSSGKWSAGKCVSEVVGPSPPAPDCSVEKKAFKDKQKVRKKAYKDKQKDRKIAKKAAAQANKVWKECKKNR